MDLIMIPALAVLFVINIIMLVMLAKNAKVKNIHDATERQLEHILQELEAERARSDRAASLMRQEMLVQFKNLGDSTLQTMTQISSSTQLNMDKLRDTVDGRLSKIQEESEKRLNEMRETVDKKLSETLSTGLQNSFKTVNTQLEQVYKSMGEMRTLTAGIGDLKNILANVKTRGTWGEIQLGRLIEDILAPGQFERDVSLQDNREKVEYAVKLPGLGSEPVYLPIDSKFPMDRYSAVLAANESADPARISAAMNTLLRAVMDEGKKIRDKYVLPPKTTDFAILFVPSEGLYSVLASQDMGYKLQSELRIMLAGPSTLCALLNSLQIGFKSVAIEKQSAEISKLLGAIKKAFGNFSDNVDKTLGSLQAATNNLNRVRGNATTIKNQLRSVEELSEENSRVLLGDELFEEPGEKSS